jgi:hypothetical protein
LRRHIELNHKVDQKVTCIGCKKSFYRACLFIEHLEFGYCDVIPASQFQGHIVHKHLVTELLKGSEAYERFKQKTSKFDAAVDFEEEGGVELEDPLGDDEEMDEVVFKAIPPDASSAVPQAPSYDGVPFPPLPAHLKTAGGIEYEVASSFGGLSLVNGSTNGDDESDTSTVIGFPVASPIATTFETASMPSVASRKCSSTHGSSVRNDSARNGSSAQGSSTSRGLKVWSSRSGKSASTTLFPNAKPTPAPSDFSISAHDYDKAMEQEHGINIMRTRFWDPMSTDWNPDKFYDSVISKYHCPFVCE